MIVNEYIILSVIGRSGTTILRNELGKYENICCLITPVQESIYKYFPSYLKFCSYFIKDFINKDIVNLYGAGDKNWEKIDTIIFKTPIHNVLYYGNLTLLKRFKPIVIVRHPIINVLSASNVKFASSSLPREELLKMILNTYNIFNQSYPESLVKNFNKKDIIEQNAIIYKLSFESTFYYLNNVYSNGYLLIKFEDLLSNPLNILLSVLEFLGKEISINEIERKINQNIYKNVYEEGGILMSENLSSKYKNKYNLVNTEIKEYLKNFLKNEIRYLGYEF